MKKITTLVLISLMVLLNNQAIAQTLIAVQNGGTPKFYTKLDSAVTYAQNGDTLYLPGGTFTLSAPIGKRLHIIGVGHNIDSTLVTDQTRIDGNIELINDASNGSLTGVYHRRGVFNSGENISNYLVQRCFLEAPLQLKATSLKWSFVENIIRGSFNNASPGASNIFFYNNIIDSRSYTSLYGFTSSVFLNNIFLFLGGCYGGGFCDYPISASNSTFENNIFISSGMSSYGISYSEMNNNLFVENISITPRDLYNRGSNNIVNQAQSSIFVNQTGNEFNYSHDYHLQSTSLGKNAGIEKTDIGIYGGFYPWKDGSLPSNPHIQFENVSGVDGSGNIHVKIKVAAQDH